MPLATTRTDSGAQRAILDERELRSRLNLGKQVVSGHMIAQMHCRTRDKRHPASASHDNNLKFSFRAVDQQNRKGNTGYCRNMANSHRRTHTGEAQRTLARATVRTTRSCAALECAHWNRAESGVRKSKYRGAHAKIRILSLLHAQRRCLLDCRIRALRRGSRNPSGHGGRCWSAYV